jgi:hypothetical protein
MAIAEFIKDHFRKRLEKSSCLVIYDPSCRHKELVQSMAGDGCKVIDGSASTILARETAMDAWRDLADHKDGLKYLIIYLPIKKPVKEQEKQRNPYQIFAIGGSEFPADDGDEYKALCHKAMPDHVAEIDKLFAAGTPDFATIDALEKGNSWPTLRTMLKEESPREILVAFLSPSDVQKKALEADASWVHEFTQFVALTLGLKLRTKGTKWASISEELGRYVFFSEFVFDLPGDLPEELKDVPVAPEAYKDIVYSVCDSLRSTDKHQVAYMDMANRIEEQLNLEKRMIHVEDLGQKDTFAFEERTFLLVFVKNVLAGNIGKAQDVANIRKNSIWVRNTDERQILWTISERALELLNEIDAINASMGKNFKDLADILSAYCDRLQKVDKLQRNFEQAVADSDGQYDPLSEFIEVARKRYLEFIEEIQKTFIELVQKEGWPASGHLRNTQVFDRFVAPSLEAREKIAFVMVDALRYELALELRNKLSDDYVVELHPVCAQLPTVTDVGMASLLPAADSKLTLIRDNDDLIPSLGGMKIRTPDDRLQYMKGIYGDRCHMIDLDDLLKKKNIKFPVTMQLLVVKTTDIDNMAEIMPREAPRFIPSLIKKMISAVSKLAGYEFKKAVFATDHGFVLFNEQEAGDTVPKPDGEWLKTKARSLLGCGSANPGTVLFDISQVGIRGDVEHYVVPRTYGTFSKSGPYSHEGLSLQECVLPLLSIDLQKEQKAEIGVVDIVLSYKGGASAITTRRPMIEISWFTTDLFASEVEFQLEAYVKAKLVAEATSCSYLNPATNLIGIKPGNAIKVPLKMQEDFEGSFEVKAIDPSTGVVYGKPLKLKTDYME